MIEYDVEIKSLDGLNDHFMIVNTFGIGVNRHSLKLNLNLFKVLITSFKFL